MHCHRELFHAQWTELLDDEFVNAYEHGLILTCADGIERQLYPHIFTYLADYPEKYAIMHIGFSSNNVALTFFQSADSKCSHPGCMSMPTVHHSKGPHTSFGDRERHTPVSASGM